MTGGAEETVFRQSNAPPHGRLPYSTGSIGGLSFRRLFGGLYSSVASCEADYHPTIMLKLDSLLAVLFVAR